MHDEYEELPSFMTGVSKEAGGKFSLITKAKGLGGTVKNWFRGAKASPVPSTVPSAPKAWGTAPTNVPIAGSQYGAFAPKPAVPPAAAAPSWMGRAKQVGGGALSALNAASTPLFAYSMMQDMWGGGGGAEQQAAEVDPNQQMQAQAQGQGAHPGYFAGFDPRNEPMQGNAGDWFRGIFTRGRNPAVEQQNQQQHAALGHYAAQVAGKG